jgi:hypothetical protein
VKKNTEWGCFENKVMTRLYWSWGKEVTGGWRKLHNEELHNLSPRPLYTFKAWLLGAGTSTPLPSQNSVLLYNLMFYWRAATNVFVKMLTLLYNRKYVITLNVRVELFCTCRLPAILRSVFCGLARRCTWTAATWGPRGSVQGSGEAPFMLGVVTALRQPDGLFSGLHLVP